MMLAIRAPHLFRQANFPRSYEWLFLVVPFGDVCTVLTNLEPVTMGDSTLPSLGFHDGIFMTIEAFQSYFVPYLIGRVAFSSYETLVDLLNVLATASVLYVPFILIELQTGPMLNLWIYGYYQHDFQQSIRGTGFRPMVFMAHGLALALFMHNALLSSWFTAERPRSKIFGLPAKIVTLGMTILFPFIKSSAALVYAATSISAFKFLSARAHLRIATTLVVIFSLYPFIRIFWPDFMWNVVYYIGMLTSPDRIASLGYRIMSEGYMTARVALKPLFGWGGYERNTLAIDTMSGEVRHIVCDGGWIIVLGMNGFVGWIPRFSVLIGPVLVARKYLSSMDPQLQRAVSCLALIVSYSTADLLPNGMFNVLPMMLAGALAGTAWHARSSSAQHKKLLPLFAAWYVLKKRGAQAALPLRTR
jgi:hypothetical protein